LSQLAAKRGIIPNQTPSIATVIPTFRCITILLLPLALCLRFIGPRRRRRYGPWGALSIAWFRPVNSWKNKKPGWTSVHPGFW